MRRISAIACCSMLAGCAAVPMHLTYDTLSGETKTGAPTVLSATVETFEVRMSVEPPDAVRLSVECGVRESRERTVTESEQVRFRVSNSSFAAAVTGSLWRSQQPVAQDTNGNAGWVVLAVMFGLPVVALGVDVVSLAVTAPVTLTAGAFAGGDHEESEVFDFRYHRPATSITLTDLRTGSSLTLTDQPRHGWLLQPQELGDLGFRSRNLLLEGEGHAQQLSLPSGFFPTACADAVVFGP